MTARHDPHDQLTHEERALAALLGAPSGEPSAALDARILGAARSAAATPASLSSAPATSVPLGAIDAERRRRHQRPRGLRWARVGGVAASMVVVLGLGWRLSLEGTMQREMADDAASARVAESVTVVQLSKPPAPPPASEPVPPQPADVAADAAAAEATMAAPAAANEVPQAAPQPPLHAQRKAVPPPPPPPEIPAEAMASPPPVPAPVAAPAPTGSARGVDNARPAAAAADAASEELDRVSVTGSRVRIVDVEISDDARLPIAAWFERIRRRRADGDIDGARGSLARFRAQHPRVAIPDDLRALDVGSR